MKAVVLEKQHVINVREVPGDLVCGPGQLRIAPHTVGICGSDVHYYTHGRIGRYIVETPMRMMLSLSLMKRLLKRWQIWHWREKSVQEV